MSEKFHNYDFGFCNTHSVVSTDDHGNIINTSLPFNKYKGRKIDDVVHELQRDKKSFKDMKDLGTTDGVPLVMKK